MLKYWLGIVGLFVWVGCSTGFTPQEVKVIKEGGGIMRVWKTDNREDSLFLRQQAIELTPGEIRTELFQVLKQRMLATVNDSADPDVVGEVWRSNEIVVRYIPELTSVKRMLSREKTDSTFKFEVKVEYRNTWEPVCDTIRGFTAVIFQHEIDHLNGILFTDKMIKE